MSFTTKLQIRTLARDPSGQLADAAGSLTKAENIVLRAPGVAESRPNFQLYAQKSAGTSLRVRSIREFQGEVVAIEEDTLSPFTWRLRRLLTDTAFLGSISEPAPVDYGESETMFAEARESLYFTSLGGVRKVDDVTDTTNGLILAGADCFWMADLATANGYMVSASPSDFFSWAYCFVAVREDANGYVRRSAPSERYVVTNTASYMAYEGTRVFFDKNLRTGDKVEIYRTFRTAGVVPSPEMYLVTTYTITATDITNRYFDPPYDSVTDDQLGATLYTSPSQGGALSAKYIPPQCQSLAWWQNVMWFGRTAQKHRTPPLTIRSVGEGGVFLSGTTLTNSATFTAGSPVVVVPDSSQMRKDDYFSDNERNGTALPGTYVPAFTRILSVDTPTQITLTANALASSGVAVRAGVVSRYPLSGIQSFNAGGPAGTGGTHTLGSNIVTGIADTSELRAGMGWSDNATTPALAGTLTDADTLIDAVLSGSSIRLTKNAIASGSGGRAFDTVIVDGVVFYAWGDATYFSSRTPPWSWALRVVPYYDNSASSGTQSARYGQAALASFMSSLAMAVNYYASQNRTWQRRASIFGDVNWDQIAVSDWAATIVFEELGVGGAGFDVLVSRPTAFNLTDRTLSSSNDDRQNRLYWSALDEPEAVPVANFLDLGSASAPILQLAPLTDALLVFKTDGVWRLTGSGPSAWTAECLDQETRLLRPECVAVTGDAAFIWAQSGFLRVTMAGVESISANTIDVELRAASQYIYDDPAFHGAFVAAWRARQLVLFGVPGDINTPNATRRIYALSLVTQSISEWPLTWGPVCESKLDNLYYTRIPEVTPFYEVRQAVDLPRGYDRNFALASIVSLSGTTLVIAISAAGSWLPEVGDYVSAEVSGCDQLRRIEDVTDDGVNYTLTLESTITGSTSDWQAYEGANAIITMEWPTAAPEGIPAGSMCRELQVQVDLRDAPDSTKTYLLPEYLVGGSSERDTAPYTVTSNRALTLTQQPIRVGCSRQIARSALLRPYFRTSAAWCVRINGLSLVWEGLSERTRR